LAEVAFDRVARDPVGALGDALPAAANCALILCKPLLLIGPQGGDFFPGLPK
jgi:hypothetical protein